MDLDDTVTSLGTANAFNSTRYSRVVVVAIRENYQQQLFLIKNNCEHCFENHISYRCDQISDALHSNKHVTKQTHFVKHQSSDAAKLTWHKDTLKSK